MSILGGRLAGKEAAFFFEESKRAVTRLADTIPNKASPPPTTTTFAAPTAAESADVLPEVLRHSLPAKFFRQERLSDSPAPLSTGSSKWKIRSPRNSDTQFSSVSRDSLDPLRGYISLPQVTLGPKRWQLPPAESSVLASTANELRRDQYTQANPEKLRAVAEGLSQIAKAFVAATAIVFGGAALAVSKLDLHNIDDIRSKGRDLVQPKFDTIKERLSPLRDWAENTSKKWRIKNEHEIKEKPMIKELSKILGVNTST